MKYNKRERQAIDALYEFADALKHDKTLILGYGEVAAIREVFGFDILSEVKSKTELKAEDLELKRKKDQTVLKTVNYCGGYKYKHCYFPFQFGVKL